MILDFK